MFSHTSYDATEEFDQACRKGPGADAVSATLPAYLTVVQYRPAGTGAAPR